MTDERRQELDELMLNETNDPETQEWRDDLTAEEQEYVNAEDERYVNFLVNVYNRICEIEEKRGGRDIANCVK